MPRGNTHFQEGAGGALACGGLTLAGHALGIVASTVCHAGKEQPTEEDTGPGSLTASARLAAMGPLELSPCALWLQEAPSWQAARCP